MSTATDNAELVPLQRSEAPRDRTRRGDFLLREPELIPHDTQQDHASGALQRILGELQLLAIDNNAKPMTVKKGPSAEVIAEESIFDETPKGLSRAEREQYSPSEGISPPEGRVAPPEGNHSSDDEDTSGTSTDNSDDEEGSGNQDGGKGKDGGKSKAGGEKKRMAVRTDTIKKHSSVQRRIALKMSIQNRPR